MSLSCNVCGSTSWERRLSRGDGKTVVFCAACGMGTLEAPPLATAPFYADGYYDAAAEGLSYADYSFTAAHALLWARLLIETAQPQGGRILDVGCADGSLLASLHGPFARFGVEVNGAAAVEAARRGVHVLGSDIADASLAEWGRFDVVTAMATLEHVLDLRGAVRTCLDLVLPGGFFLYEVPLISETADNKDWLHGSYEHISYPTVRGLEALFASFPGVRHAGFETEIQGFSASYIGVAAADEAGFTRVAPLLRQMAHADLPATAEPGSRRLNLAYHVVHGFRPSPARVLALPELLEVAATPPLLKRLTQLWYADSVAASGAANLAAQLAYEASQRQNWQLACEQAVAAYEASQLELKRLHAESGR